MSSERRIHARRVLYSPEYLDMGADNGGVVVNLSEGGLAFQAVAPVVPQSEIPLSFSLNPGYRIDVKARVVWVNAEGKFGGAVFGKLSKDSQSLIREWLAKADVEHESESAFVTRTPEGETQEIVSEGTLPVNPHPSTVATQMTEAAASESVARGNGSELPSSGAGTAAESVETLTFAPHEMASPQIPANESISPKFPTSALPKQSRNASVAAEARRGVSATPPIHQQAPTPPPAAEPRRQRSSGASYSVAPSIAAWSKNDSHPSARSAAPAFPPRNTENIFARSPSHFEHERRGRGSGVLMIFAFVIAAGAVVAFYARTHRQQIGNEISQIGNTIAGTPAAGSTKPLQTTPASANPAAGSSSNGNASAPTDKPGQTAPPTASQATIPTTSTATPQQSANQGTSPLSKIPDSTTAPTTQAAPLSGGSVSPGVPKPQTPTNHQSGVPATQRTSSNTSVGSPLLGQAEYQRAENYLSGRGVARDSAQAAEWFWRSLEAGNTDAAIPLADLYISGNGVSRSCKQARILLDAAAQKNNTTAIKKLSELPENCN